MWRSWVAVGVVSAAILAAGAVSPAAQAADPDGVGPTYGRLMWSAVSAGGAHTCAISVEGALYCWGRNGDAELGLGGFRDRLVPNRVGIDTDWVQVSSGSYFSCAVKADATGWCWGSNVWGQLGTGDTQRHTTPVQVGAAGGWRSITAMGATACGIQVDGSLWCWGWNDSGQVGDGTTEARYLPVPIGDRHWRWRDVAGDSHTCAVRQNGFLYCWGDNFAGQLGTGDSVDRHVPTRVGTDEAWQNVAAGFWYTCAVAVDASGWCWGDHRRAARNRRPQFPAGAGSHRRGARLGGTGGRQPGDLWRPDRPYGVVLGLRGAWRARQRQLREPPGPYPGGGGLRVAASGGEHVPCVRPPCQRPAPVLGWQRLRRARGRNPRRTHSTPQGSPPEGRAAMTRTRRLRAHRISGWLAVAALIVGTWSFGAWSANAARQYRTELTDVSALAPNDVWVAGNRSSGDSDYFPFVRHYDVPPGRLWAPWTTRARRTRPRSSPCPMTTCGSLCSGTSTISLRCSTGTGLPGSVRTSWSRATTRASTRSGQPPPPTSGRSGRTIPPASAGP